MLLRSKSGSKTSVDSTEIHANAPYPIIHPIPLSLPIVVSDGEEAGFHLSIADDEQQDPPTASDASPQRNDAEAAACMHALFPRPTFDRPRGATTLRPDVLDRLTELFLPIANPTQPNRSHVQV